MEAVVPPGFRFHPTEEELVGYYLLRRIKSMKIDVDVIVDIDLYKMEPWDIQARCNLGYEDQNEWYFFSHKDRKYPTGTRTNRATAAGFWKATGRDKAVMSKNSIIGMRKTLVFYKGRAPNGSKTDWIMHEYRHQTIEYAPPQEEGWVVCRAFKKPIPNQRPAFEAWNTCSHRPPYHITAESAANEYYALHASNLDKLLESSNNEFVERLPQLESPTLFPGKKVALSLEEMSNQFTDWKSLDSLFAFQGNDTAVFPFQDKGDLEAEFAVGHFLGCSNSNS